MYLKPTIICVDHDSGDLQSLIADVAARFGEAYDTVGCQSHQEALAHLDRLSGVNVPVAMCLSPLEPSSGGTELLARIAQTYPAAIRAILTAEGRAETALAAMRRDGIDHYLVKPFRPPHLEETFGKLLKAYETRVGLRREVAPCMGQHLFVTGATGFIGERLVREFLRCTQSRMTLLCRSLPDTPFDERIDLKSEDYEGRVDFVEGDVTQPSLGLSPDTVARLAETVDEVWHLAAITAFDNDIRDRIFRTNLFGTANMVSFASALPKLTCFNHFSTAYISGTLTHPHVAMEEADHVPKGFKNPYEESKYYAERVVASSGLPHIVYRPSIVIGESYSGRCDDKTIYGVAKIYRFAQHCANRSAAKRGKTAEGTFRVVGVPQAAKNVIPVDCMLDMMLRIRRHPKALGKVFHLTHPKPTTVGDVTDAIADMLGLPSHDLVEHLNDRPLSLEERLLRKALTPYQDYMTLSDPVFDQANTLALIGERELPAIDPEYLRFCIRSFFDYHPLHQTVAV